MPGAVAKVCYKCKKEKKANNSKLVECAVCLNSYHPLCTSLTSVTTEGGRIRRCPSCQSLSDTPNKTMKNETLRPRTGSTTSNSPRPLSPLSLPVPSTPAEIPTSALELIMSKLSILDIITTDLTAMKSSLSVLDQIPVLIEELKDVRERITNLEENQRALRADVDALASGSGVQSPDMANRLRGLEESQSQAIDRCSSLENAVSRLSLERARQSAELTITGMKFDEEKTDIKRLALAVIRSVFPPMQPNFIVSARLMRRKSKPSSPSSSSSTTTASQRSPMLAVTLLSPVLVKEVLQAKRKVGKLHTNALDPTVLMEAGLTTPLMPTLININEMLPPEIHQLRNAAFIECRGRNYISFVQDGSVYVKKKKEDTPTLITSVEQLNNFCEG
uniref:PHD-type domain-containing protein n=1 Tax=Bracon brevicornis TaxID=1563983 RepID=A0A6V7LRN2_9HYME